MQEAYCHSLKRVISSTEAQAIFLGREKEYKYDFACQHCMVPMICANLDNDTPKRPVHFRTRRNTDHRPECKYELQRRASSGNSQNLTGEYPLLKHSTKEILKISLLPEPAPSASGVGVNYQSSGSPNEQTFTRANPATPVIGSVQDLLLRAEKHERDGTFSEKSVIIGSKEIPYPRLIVDSHFGSYETDKPQLFIGWSRVRANNTADKIIFLFTDMPSFDGEKKKLTAILERSAFDKAATLRPKLKEDLALIEKSGYAHTAIFGKPRMVRKSESKRLILYVEDMKAIFFSPTHLPPRAVHTRNNPKSLKNPPNTD